MVNVSNNQIMFKLKFYFLDFDINQFGYYGTPSPQNHAFLFIKQGGNLKRKDYKMRFGADSNYGPHRNCNLSLDEQRTQVILPQRFCKYDIAQVTGLYAMDFLAGDSMVHGQVRSHLWWRYEKA
ncbi:hypothetical protein RND71_003236 [Anisodus tanguticus]|uniref:Uncharacterized protein n=1 Tax=Anisodus tanguticus TaxID=243964 RepID=A0AAE1SW99_9SOLA|nr:hypothetical protein RND71_003236 [Anisodus tanguticus]